VAYRYPGADGRVGTGDDVASADVTTIVGSDPNLLGRHSFAAFEAFVADPALPGSNTAISFLGGVIELDPAVAASGGGPLIVAGGATETGFGQGLSDTLLTILAVNGGSYDPVTGAMTLDVDIEAALVGTTRQYTNQVLSGTATVIDSADFGTATGDAYLDNVLIPRAQSLNADGLVLIELSGTAPLDPPWVIIPAPFTVVLAGLTGVPASATADLAVGKTGPAGPAVAGETISFTLSATNNGASAASGVVVIDRLGDSLTWNSDTCGAGPPAGGRLTWNIGPLGAGSQATCQVEATLAADTAFDVGNAAVVLATTRDPDPSDNIAAATVTAGQAAPVEGLAQAPDQATGFPSDRDCDACPLDAQAMADNFRVAQQFRLGAVTFHGGYTDNQPFADDFVVEIRADAETSAQPGIPGVPGSLVATASGGGGRIPTGNLVAAALDEYRYRVPINATLSRGRYWVLVYNDSSAAGGSGDWFWATGQPDAQNRSLATITANNTIPPHPRWSPNSDFELALAIEPGAPAAVPALRGLALAALAAGLLCAGLLAAAARTPRPSSNTPSLNTDLRRKP